jgi:hypothetical protein
MFNEEIMRAMKHVKVAALVVAAGMAMFTPRGISAPEHAPRISADQALQRLMNGNKRAVAAKFVHPDQTVARRVAV